MSEPFHIILKRCGEHNPDKGNFPEKWIAVVVGYKGKYVYGRSEKEALDNVNNLIKLIEKMEEESGYV